MSLVERASFGLQRTKTTLTIWLAGYGLLWGRGIGEIVTALLQSATTNVISITEGADSRNL